MEENKEREKEKGGSTKLKKEIGNKKKSDEHNYNIYV